ncbi:hypothetical protein PSY31_24080, partial [Shigella flexneri]|nr:hypothetical protein [Shigella flexneri]
SFVSFESALITCLDLCPICSQVLISLGDMVNKLFKNSLLDWGDRTKIVDCICNFVSFRPHIAQVVSYF